MTKARRRRLALIHVLSDLSRDGWKNARFDDCAPVEKELREIETENDK
jgi:hypothetical protein